MGVIVWKETDRHGFHHTYTVDFDSMVLEVDVTHDGGSQEFSYQLEIQDGEWCWRLREETLNGRTTVISGKIQKGVVEPGDVAEYQHRTQWHAIPNLQLVDELDKRWNRSS